MKPEFRAGRNIAIKVPEHEYDATVAFYRDILALPLLASEAPSATDTTRFEFGDKVLWIDRVTTISQAEIWLEILTDDVDRACTYLQSQGLVRRDGIEPLPDGFQGFWLSSPANVVHLVTSTSL